MRTLTTAQRSRMMAAIHGKDTWPEQILRKTLFAKRFRYRLHIKNLPGTPDLVFRRYNAVVFVHGCFWHRHEGCRYTTIPQRNAKFWQDKFQGNVERDRRDVAKLQSMGWRVAIVWECALKESIEETCGVTAEWLIGNKRTLVVGQSASTSGG